VNFKEDMQEWMRTESCSCSSWAAGSSAMFFCHHTGGEILYGKAIIYGSNSWFCSLQLLQYYVEIRETQEL